VEVQLGGQISRRGGGMVPREDTRGNHQRDGRSSPGADFRKSSYVKAPQGNAVGAKNDNVFLFVG